MADQEKCTKCGRYFADYEQRHDTDFCWKYDPLNCLETQLSNLTAENKRLREENVELNSLFALQSKRLAEATAYWQERMQRKDLFPDLGCLLTFLLKEIKDKDETIRRIRFP